MRRFASYDQRPWWCVNLLMLGCAFSWALKDPLSERERSLRTSGPLPDFSSVTHH